MRKKHPFLLLELLIALFIVSFVAIPLAEIPMGALREEMKSLYRMQTSRIADLGYAKIREKLHQKEIPWEILEKSGSTHVPVFEDTCSLSLDSSSSKQFMRKGFIKTVRKKKKDGDEWFLLLSRVEIEPIEKKGFSLFRKNLGKEKKQMIFAYYTILHRKIDIVTPKAP